ncbi:response regulator transcription factor [Maribacter algarum]|uniref:Response regulator transcription factor n=1 Tax=Maribacter algarum (ex Zhang et al. 2020) TaxID=2578118 RepID=A0A5S3PRQ0_9FLAO|nr:LytTR family DNA-binding domain-containing protein [Maribacter algarum]TMM57417.1 response regulator transcription factor [Maribacter algarum]
MRPINCVVIDDEPLAREGLINYIQKIEFLTFIGEGSDPTDLFAIEKNQSPDLIFMDIQMPTMTGIEYLKSTKNRPMVIITTAYPSYALEGFELDVLDYMVKPITFERFFKGVYKAKDYFSIGKGETNPLSFNAKPDYFFVKCDSVFEKIFFNDVAYVQALQNYVIIYTSHGKFMPLLTMKRMEELLGSEKFIRVHKSYLVAVDKIRSIESTRIKLEGAEIPLSRNYKDAVFKKVLDKSLFKK